MAGLMEKDFRILLQRKQAFLVFLVIAVLLSVTQGGAGVVGYLPFISAMLAVSTISYDEFDNGYPFLFTLPITRKSYVAEKYIFCFLTVFCSWIFSVILYVVIDKLQGGEMPVSEMLFVSILLLLIAVVLMDVMVAVQLKYGSERSRVVIIAIFGICFLAIYALAKLLEKAGVETAAVFGYMERISATGIVLLLLAVGIVATFISVLISIAVMEKKTF
ncbi:MAG: ABC-2 transporter permease [Agathobacter sp.]